MDHIARKNFHGRRSLKVSPKLPWKFPLVRLIALQAMIVFLLASPKALFSDPPTPQVRIIESEPPGARAFVNRAKVDVPELRYRILARFKNVFYCDPDLYPTGLSPAEGRRRALDTFPEIKKDQDAFRVIVHHLGFSETGILSDEQKFLIYREFNKLRGAVQVERLDDQFRFNVDLREKTGGVSVQGVINRDGSIVILKRENTFFMCPL